jgi:hypothetical protein
MSGGFKNLQEKFTLVLQLFNNKYPIPWNFKNSILVYNFIFIIFQFLVWER